VSPFDRDETFRQMCRLVFDNCDMHYTHTIRSMAVNLLREEEDVETASSISHTTASTALLYLPPSGSPSPPSTPSTSAETTTATASKEQRHRLLLGLGLGQILSLLIAGTGIFSSLLAEQGLSLPATQACLTYILLSLHLTRRPRGQPLHVTWWKYLVLAAIDLEGNYLVREVKEEGARRSVEILTNNKVARSHTLPPSLLSLPPSPYRWFSHFGTPPSPPSSSSTALPSLVPCCCPACI